MLNKEGKFIKLAYSRTCFNYITDDVVIDNRKKMHCFRRSADEAIKERASYTEEQKNFMIDYGLVFVKVIRLFLMSE